MKDAKNIQILGEEVIIHIMEPGGDGLVLSSKKISLHEKPKLIEYFVNHIKRSLNDSQNRAAKFPAITPGEVSGICQDLLNGRIDLIPGSQELATLLYTAMSEAKQRYPTISSGDLAVCFYQAENYPGRKFLALLKIDPSEVYQRKTTHDRNGRVYVQLTLQEDALPSNERLQKCAFIGTHDQVGEYHIVLLDRQAGLTRTKHVAKYFAEDFMKAELAFDNALLTTVLYRELMKTHQRLRPSLSENDSQQLLDSIRGVLKVESINLDDWLGGLPLADENKVSINKAISKKLPDREFEIDKNTAEKLARFRTFVGENSLKITISEADYEKLIQDRHFRVEHITDKPGRNPFYRIVMELEEWYEVDSNRRD